MERHQAENSSARGLPDVPPLAAPHRTIHMIGNSHIDPVWLWPWQEGYAEARATFASAIARMNEYDDFMFTCDQVVLLAWVKEADPGLFEQIRARVAEGRWVNTGGWWVEPDCNAPMGESFVRQGLYGQRFLLAEFGEPATVGMNADPFGHNAMIPAILRGQGMDSYCFLRPGPHEADLFDVPFWWRSPDGSQVLASRIPFEYCSAPGELAHQTEKSLGQLDRSRPNLMIFYGVGNHGGGPTKANIDSIHWYHRMGTFGKMIMSSPRIFFDEIIAEGSSNELPVWSADLQHHAAGCYSAHSGIKAWQRRAQHSVLGAERWAIVAEHVAGKENPALAYPRAELGIAWKQVLFNQFHDVLPGSAIEPGYDDARDQLGEAVSISKRITVRSHNAIARLIDIPMIDRTQPVVVFNPHPWPVSANLEINYAGPPNGVHLVDASGVDVAGQPVQPMATIGGRGALLFAADVPALGYRLYRIVPDVTAPKTDLTINTAADGRIVLANRKLRVAIDPESGWLTSLVDLRTDTELAGRGPHLQLCQDPTDTWGHRVVSYAWPGETMPVTRVRITESGPLRATVRVERAWNRTTMIEQYRLSADSDALQIDFTIDWHEPNHLLKLRFPVAVTKPQATFEIPFATLERPVDGAEEPAQSWVDLAGEVDGKRAGLVVINNAKHGYDASPADSPVPDTDPSIGITAVRSPVYGWHAPTELDPDGIYRYQAQGEQQFSCLLIPHSGNWRDVEPTRRAAELGAKPRAMLETFHPGPLAAEQSFVEVVTAEGPGKVIAVAVKGAEDPGAPSDLIIRLSETTGATAQAEVRLPLMDRSFICTLTSYQLRTFRVPAAAGVEIREVNLIERDLPTA